jgi:putative tryptophan/tyrosine transport system substrate-binding protein
MKRRQFISLVGAAAAWPFAVRAQHANRAPVVGFIGSELRLRQFREGLADLGYVERRDLAIEYRSSDPADQLPRVAAELVALKVDVIVAGGSQAVRAVQQATSSIPIVMTGSSDPVETGFVESLARPGRNITGMSLQSPELAGKRIQFLREMVPDRTKLGILLNSDDPPVVFSLQETEKAAHEFGLALELAEVRRPQDFDSAFASLRQRQAGALIVLPASLMTRYAERIAALALDSRLPAMAYFREFPDVGGLMSYGPNFDELSHQAAGYVSRILKGAKPDELPVQQPTKFELVINLKTARALDLRVPPTLIDRADATVE